MTEKQAEPNDRKFDKKEVITICCAVVGTLCAVPSAVISSINAWSTENDKENSAKIFEQVEKSAKASELQAEYIEDLAVQMERVAIETEGQSILARARSESSARSAEASESMANIAQKQLERQQALDQNARPRLEISRLGMRGLETVGTGSLSLAITLENLGPKPAGKVTISQFASLSSMNSRGILINSCQSDKTISLDAMKPLESQVVANMVNWKSEGLPDDLKSGSRGLAIYGLICYRGDDAKQYTTRYCGRVFKHKSEDKYVWEYC